MCVYVCIYNDNHGAHIWIAMGPYLGIAMGPYLGIAMGTYLGIASDNSKSGLSGGKKAPAGTPTGKQRF